MRHGLLSDVVVMFIKYSCQMDSKCAAHECSMNVRVHCIIRYSMKCFKLCVNEQILCLIFVMRYSVLLSMRSFTTFSLS